MTTKPSQPEKVPEFSEIPNFPKFPPRCILDATELFITGDAPAFLKIPCEKAPYLTNQDIDYMSVAEAQALADAKAAGAVAELEQKLATAISYLKQGKAKFTPHTTNSLIDDFIKDNDREALQEKAGE